MSMNVEDLNLMEEAKSFCKSHGLGTHNIQMIKEAMEIGCSLVAKLATRELAAHRVDLEKARIKSNSPQ